MGDPAVTGDGELGPRAQAQGILESAAAGSALARSVSALGDHPLLLQPPPYGELGSAPGPGELLDGQLDAALQEASGKSSPVEPEAEPEAELEAEAEAEGGPEPVLTLRERILSPTTSVERMPQLAPKLEQARGGRDGTSIPSSFAYFIHAACYG